jgi:hypothetical protein
MQSPTAGLARAAVLVGALMVASASDFEISKLNKDGGDWGFVQGSARCPTVLKFADDHLSIKAEDIKINTEACTGGTLMLLKNPDKGGTLLTEALRKLDQRDTSYEGVLEDALACGPVRLVNGTYFQVRSSSTSPAPAASNRAANTTAN